MENKIKRRYAEWIRRKEEKKRKEEFTRRLKFGKPQGRTRPPMRLTDDPGPS